MNLPTTPLLSGYRPILLALKCLIALPAAIAVPQPGGSDGLLIHRQVPPPGEYSIESVQGGRLLQRPVVEGLREPSAELVTVGTPAAELSGLNQSADQTAWFVVPSPEGPLLPAPREDPREKIQQSWQQAWDYLAGAYEYVDSGELIAVEPNVVFFDDAWDHDGEPTETAPPEAAPSSTTGLVVADAADPSWPKFPHPTAYLDSAYSQLRAAHAAVGPQDAAVRIAILDVGFLPQHAAFPPNHLPAVEIADPQRSSPNGRPGEPWFPHEPRWLNRSAHGTSTAAILAGPVRPLQANGQTQAQFQGGNPSAEIEPIRIGGSVIAATRHWTRISDVATGFDWARKNGAEVISMSVGGLPSEALADAVNAAYRAGIPMFCATGDFIVWQKNPLFTSPKNVVYPAAYRPVMAVAGVTASGRAYGKLPVDPWRYNSRLLLGSRGPGGKMENAVSAWSPNLPWAHLPSDQNAPPDDPWNRPGPWNRVDLNGGGTSAATPQVAAAASLLIARHRQTLHARFPQGWQRAEAVYWLIRESARSPDQPSQKFFGRGLLQARDALDHPLPQRSDLPFRRPSARSSWLYVMRLILSSGGGSPLTPENARMQMGAILKQALRGNMPSPSTTSAFFAAWAQLMGTEIQQAIVSDFELHQLWAAASANPLDPALREALIRGLLRSGYLSPRTQAALREVRQPA